MPALLQTPSNASLTQVYRNAALGWVTLLITTLGYGMMHESALTLMLSVVSIQFIMVIVRSTQAFRANRYHQAAAFAFTTLHIDALVQHVQHHPDDIWLGIGFNWQPQHTQQAIHFLNKQDTQHHASTPQKGAAWLNRVETKHHDLYLPLNVAAGHLLVEGTTGAGKTRCFDLLITQAILRGEAVIILDPKGDKDLKQIAQGVCQKLGKDDQFIFFHPGFPEDSVRMNPLRNFTRGTEIASRVATLIPSETGADPFKAFGQMALNHIVQGLLIIHERPDLLALRHYIESGPDTLVLQATKAWTTQRCPHKIPLMNTAIASTQNVQKQAHRAIKVYREHVQPTAPHADLEGLHGMYEHDRTHYAKMIASLTPVLTMLTSSELGPLLSPDVNELTDQRPITDLSRVINSGQVCYIGTDSLTDGIVGSALGSLFLSELAAIGGNNYNYIDDIRPINVFIDEAAEIVNDSLIQLLNKGRGAGFHCVLATQTFADFTARTGSDAKTRQILGNINNRIILRVLDAETQEYVTAGLPEVYTQRMQHTHNTASDTDDPLGFRGSHVDSLVEERTPLFPSALLGQLPDLEFIASFSGGPLLKGRLPLLTGLDDLAD